MANSVAATAGSYDERYLTLLELSKAVASNRDLQDLFHDLAGRLKDFFDLRFIGLLLHERGHKAAPWVLWAAAIFAVSVTLRSLDLSLCERVVIDGRKLGTHFAWHVLNALALFLLLRASLAVGATVAERKREPVLIEAEPIDLAAAAAKAAREAEAAAKERERKTLFPT